MPSATLTSKGQTTIPREVRQFLKLKSGDKIEFKLNPDDNTVTLRAANIPVADLRGILKRPGMKPYDPEERQRAHDRRARTR